MCPVCLGFPGSLPVLNRAAFEYAILVGIALNCEVQEFTKFDRKNYFYPDLPKNYQISQYDLPVALNGFIDITAEGAMKRIRVLRVHLEEDAGKLIHKEDVSFVDFNRAGIPLLEIVSQPDLNSPQEAYEYLAALKTIIEYLGVSDCDMEKGSLRCDANVSLRKKGTVPLGTKAELKNMNSFKGVKDALTYEIQRQAGALDAGELVVQETRLWDLKSFKTVSMRSKEEAKDYRYFPEPDLPPFTIPKEKIARLEAAIPELPQAKRLRFTKEFGLPEYDAKILTAFRKDAEYAEACLKAYAGNDKKALVNWLIGPLLSEANERATGIAGLKIPVDHLVGLVKLVEDGQVSNLTGKLILSEMIATAKPPQSILQEKNLAQISDSGSLDAIIDEAIGENPKTVENYKAGKTSALMFLVGQVMKKTGSRANPKVVQQLLKRRLD